MFRRRTIIFRPFANGESVGVKGLIFTTAVAFLLQFIFPDILNFFSLDPSQAIRELKLYQLASYMFLHGSFFHIIFNLYVLYIFGIELESLWGSARFLLYYFISGIGAGIITALFSRFPVIGASGAIYGLLLAYGVLFPNRVLLISFFIPIKAKYAVIIFAVIEFLATMGGSSDGIAHITHLGGMIFGGILLAFWRLKSESTHKKKRSYFDELYGGPSSPANIDRILDKILKYGEESLTREEREILLRAGKFYKK